MVPALKRLARVNNDIMVSRDQDMPALLVLQDLSAAFDAVDHNAIFSRLKTIFSLSCKVLELIRSQRMSVHGFSSDLQFLLSSILLVIWILQCISVDLGSMGFDMALNITYLLMTPSSIYHWIRTINWVSSLPCRT